MQTESISVAAASTLGAHLVTRRDLAEKLGMSVAHLGRVMRADAAFPQPVELARGSFRWIAAEVDAWLLNRPRRSCEERAAATTRSASAALAAKRRSGRIVSTRGSNAKARTTTAAAKASRKASSEAAIAG